jgi:hypothetical protein
MAEDGDRSAVEHGDGAQLSMAGGEGPKAEAENRVRRQGERQRASRRVTAPAAPPITVRRQGPQRRAAAGVPPSGR